MAKLDELAAFLHDAPPALEGPKILLQERGWQAAIRFQVAVHAFPGPGQDRLREVRGDDPDAPRGQEVAEVLEEHQGHAVGLLPGRTGGRPERELSLGGATRHEVGEHGPQRLERRAVPEE